MIERTGNIQYSIKFVHFVGNSSEELMVPPMVYQQGEKLGDVIVRQACLVQMESLETISAKR